MKGEAGNADKKQVFQTLWIQTGGGPDYWTPEFRFATHRKRIDKMGRVVRLQYRFDWAIPQLKVAVEVDGGTSLVRRTRKGNLIAVGYHASDADRTKNNIAQLEEWMVFHFTPEILMRETDACMDLVREGIALRATGLPGISRREK